MARLNLALSGTAMPSPVTRDNAGSNDAAEDRIELVEPDPFWPQQFDAEAAAIHSALRAFDGIRIEHFGSTARKDRMFFVKGAALREASYASRSRAERC